MKNTLILQGVTKESHFDAVRSVFSMPDPERALISVAYLTKRGFQLVEDTVLHMAEKTTVFAGIRNGVTTAQGLLSCIDCGCITYAVDTGQHSTIFHPKIFLVRNKQDARIIIGSANLTVGGLCRNIEAGVGIEADLRVEQDRLFVSGLESTMDSMLVDFSKHVRRVGSIEDVEQLLRAGRIVDEASGDFTRPVGVSTEHGLDAVPRMELHQRELKIPPMQPFPVSALHTGTVQEGNTGTQDKSLIHDISRAAMLETLHLVWTSNPLTRRALTIPDKPTTSPTGSMLFAKGATAGIDQRHYFREAVFGKLDWQKDKAKNRTHLERARTKFRIIVQGIDYGIQNLALTHDSRMDSEAYRQKNSMTQVHWGEARHIVAREHILGRIMRLYENSDTENTFTLTVD